MQWLKFSIFLGHLAYADVVDWPVSLWGAGEYGTCGLALLWCYEACIVGVAISGFHC